jgi:predicted nucleic acid-binding Zn ribbon protein
MPTYVYKFVETGETIEVQQSFDEPTLTEAPHPGDGRPRPVKKVFTPVGITFKGNGFYKTDSRGSKSGSSSGSKSTDSSSSSSTSSSSSSSDSSGSSDSSSSSGSSTSSGTSTKEKAASSSGSSAGSGSSTGAGGHSH